MPIIVKKLTAETVNIVKNGLSFKCDRVNVLRGGVTTTVFQAIREITYTGEIIASSEYITNSGQDGLPHMRIATLSGEITPYLTLTNSNSSSFQNGSVIKSSVNGFISGSVSTTCIKLNLGTSPRIALMVDNVNVAASGPFTSVGQTLYVNYSKIPIKAGSKIWYQFTESIGTHDGVFKGGSLKLTMNT